MALVVGCSSSSGGSSSSGSSGQSSSGSSGQSSSGSSGGTGCTGDITACTLGSLNDQQKSDMCSVTLASIDAQAGTKFECNDGPNKGNFLTVNGKDQCVAQKFPATCTIKVGDLINCYKAAKSNACTALDEKGACAFIFTATKECGG